jgi:peptide deformylase
MVNPRFEVLDGSEDKILCKEGCLSFPGLFIQKARPDKIRVHWTSQDGKDIKSEEFSGITSVCIQHEIEHLDAKLFFDGVSDFKLKRSIEEANKKGYSYNYSDFRWDGMYY